ncbi:MAG: penicillin-binding protein 1A [Leptolyngbya sp.]|nr:penicillin-binding protein 1A [Leptolyngbya sp.]
MTQSWLNRLFSSQAQMSQGETTNHVRTAPPRRRGLPNPAQPSTPNQPPSPRRRGGIALPALVILVALVAGGATRTYRLVKTTWADLPDSEQALTYQRDGTITMISADGVILQKIGPASRETSSYEAIPDHVIAAFIASEDQHFYEHRGVDYRGITRAALTNLRRGSVVEGASTITQQLARIVYLSQERSIQRKAREILMAHKLERNLTKAQIMERYLNLVYLGSGAYGVSDAAWIYFGKPLEQLTVAEAALIAGMAPAPSLYSPGVNPEAALAQRDRVLQRMLATGSITPTEADTALAEDVAVTPNEPKFLYSEFPYFTIYVEKQLEQLLTPEQLAAGGLTVETTLNVDWQRKAEATVEQAIERYSGWQGIEQVALVAVDPRNGEIKAMVGGNDFNESQFNRVTQAQRQPGSTFKTFVYATAIATGMSPYKTYTDARYVVDGYEPKNYGGTFSGDVNLIKALRNSINIVAVKLLVDIGFDPVIEVAQKMGIESPLLGTYSLALGASEVNLLELTSAYGTLANQGRHAPTHGIRRVLNSQGDVLYETNAAEETVQAIDADTAAIMTWMLRSVVEGGTGSNAYIGRPVAGKTGTSEKNRDLWFIGYIPQLATGVWMGNDDSSPSNGASTTSAAIWRMFMSQITDSIPVEQFPSVPRLGGREATVEAEPIKPNRVVADRSPNDSESSDDSPTADRNRSASPTDSTPSPNEASESEASRPRNGDEEPSDPVIDPGTNRRPNGTPTTSPAAAPAPVAAPAPITTPAPVAAPAPITAPAPVEAVTPAPAPVAPPAPAPPAPVAPPPPLSPSGGEDNPATE